MLNKEMITYKVIKTDSMTEDKIKDFLDTFNLVFGDSKDKKWFNWKYKDNIYGESILIIAYNGLQSIGIRSFWRNDIQGNICYQPCDTALVKEYRGMGIFSEMSKKALENSTKGYIYNFPNENSSKGNIKMGWEEYITWYLSFIPFKKILVKEQPFIEDDYLRWRYIHKPDQNYSYTKYKEDYFLLYSRGNKMYYVLGRFNKEYKDSFNYVNTGLFFTYKNSESLTYKILKRKSTVYIYERQNNKITFKVPMNKADFF